ncbi:MAG: hypothetical protein IPM82_02555 [Saprospiraceae bacterium]|nr:hypothetical protein [Saprospiraceae bacterium]
MTKRKPDSRWDTIGCRQAEKSKLSKCSMAMIFATAIYGISLFLKAIYVTLAAR